MIWKMSKSERNLGWLIYESNETLMICRKEDEHQIKQFVTDVKIKKCDSLI